MGLAEKIEEIKRKPEHIRLRYIWFFVFVSMFFVVALWVFSLQANNSSNGTESADQAAGLDGLSSEIDQQADILRQTTKDIQDAGGNVKTGIGISSRPDSAAISAGTQDNAEKPLVNNNINTNSFPGE
jgi:hypothetical protein